MKGIVKIFCACIIVISIIFTVACTKKEEVATGPAEKLTVWVYDEGRIATLTDIGKKFEAQYGIAVEVSLVDLGQLRNQFLLATGGADCADIGIIPHDNLGSLVVNGAVIEVSLGSKASSYLEPAITGFNYNGRLYGVPLSVENIGFFYNPDLIPTPPETWDEAVAMSTALKRDGKIDFMFACPDATYNVYPVYDSFGGEIFGKNADGSLNGRDVKLADAGFVAGMEFLAAQVKAGLIPENIDWDAAHVLFESGRAPFCPTGPWALDRFRTSGINYKVTKFPGAVKGKPGNPFLGVQGMIISSASPRRLLAQSFVMEYIATESGMRDLYNADGRPSAWKSIFETSGGPDDLGFNAAGVAAVPMPSIPEMGYVWDAWVAAAALSFSGERTAAEALRNAKAQVESQSQ